MQDRKGPIFLVIAFGAMLGFLAFLLVGPRDASGDTVAGPGTTVITPEGTGGEGTATSGSTIAGSTPTTSPTGLVRDPNTIPAWTVGQPWGTTVGLTMFRGNPTRTYYGSGPLAASPAELWRYPGSPMCSESVNLGETAVWCGMGWTGQPAVWEREDGITELIFGAAAHAPT